MILQEHSANHLSVISPRVMSHQGCNIAQDYLTSSSLEIINRSVSTKLTELGVSRTFPPCPVRFAVSHHPNIHSIAYQHRSRSPSRHNPIRSYAPRQHPLYHLGSVFVNCTPYCMSLRKTHMVWDPPTPLQTFCWNCNEGIKRGKDVI
jgi:hypothetical protein